MVLSTHPTVLGKEPESIRLHQCQLSVMLFCFLNQRLQLLTEDRPALTPVAFVVLKQGLRSITVCKETSVR